MLYNNKYKQVHIYLTEETYLALSERAKKKNQGTSTYVRGLLENFVSPKKTNEAAPPPQSPLKAFADSKIPKLECPQCHELVPIDKTIEHSQEKHEDSQVI